MNVTSVPWLDLFLLIFSTCALSPSEVKLPPTKQAAPAKKKPKKETYRAGIEAIQL